MARIEHRRSWTAATVVVAVLAASGLLASPAGAATLEVTTTADGGAGSLREAVATASANAEADVILLQQGATYVLDDCAEGDLDHTAADELTITGNGATIEQTCDGERVLESDGDLVIDATTITGGEAPGGLGGGIESDVAGVTLVRSTVTGNTAGTGAGIAAIRVVLQASTISGNTATGAGGGVWADQTVELTNSTVTGNTAGTGGGLAVVNDSVTLLYATVVANTAAAGANVELQAGSDELVSFASVLAEPQGGGADCAIDPGATTTSQGANVSSDSSCGFGSAPDDLVDVALVGLGPLGSNGGLTATMVPSATSVLIDRADCETAPAAVTTDQRGVDRPQQGRCDTGAVEIVVITPEPIDPPTTTSTPTGPSGPAPLSLVG